MSKKNFTISTVATAPSPATSGTSLVVAAGEGSLFAVNEPAIVFPVNSQPLVSNAEIVMVTNVTTDTLTITRTQEGTSARAIVVGDVIIQGITAKDWNDLITSVAGKITAFADPNADRIVFWDDSAGAFAALTASTGLVLSGTNLTVRAASETDTGIVERATDAEFTDGTDTARFINAKQVASVAQTMTNKTLTSPVLNTGVSGTAVLDEDNMASNSATKLATQQSIKAYVDAQGYEWKGAWVTSTAYALNDTVENNGSGYVCTSAHTSGSTTEPGVGASWTTVWDLFVEGTDKTMPTGDIVGTTDTQTLTNKTLVSPLFQGTLDGWISAGETWEFVSVDDPTGIFRVNADVTTKYSAGMRIKMTNGGNVIYGIITVVGAYSGGYTSITFLHQIDPSDNLALYLLANSAITLNYYSSQKAPVGFPASPLSWSIISTPSNFSQESATSGTWYGAANITLPIGVWDFSYRGAVIHARTAGGSLKVYLEANISQTSASAASFQNQHFYEYYRTVIAGGNVYTFYQGVSGQTYINLTAKDVFYFNVYDSHDDTATLQVNHIRFEAICAYL